MAEGANKNGLSLCQRQVRPAAQDHSMRLSIITMFMHHRLFKTQLLVLQAGRFCIFVREAGVRDVHD